MDINFEYYKIFYYVAKFGSFTKAASALGSNQPNVTRIIKLLESQLHCTLFVRQPRGIALTQEGERLYTHVRIAYEQLMHGQNELTNPSLAETGTIEIGATETALHLFLLSRLHDFKQVFPKIRIKIHNHNTFDTLKLLANGTIDYAFITTPFENRHTFSVEKLFDFEEILVGGTQYLEYSKAPVSLKDLTDCSFIGLAGGTATYSFYNNFFLKHSVEIHLDTEVATSDLMLPMIRNNLGIGFVPKALAKPYLSNSDLVQIPLKETIPPRSLLLISDHGRYNGMTAKLFYQFLMGKVENMDPKTKQDIF